MKNTLTLKLAVALAVAMANAPMLADTVFLVSSEVETKDVTIARANAEIAKADAEAVQAKEEAMAAIVKIAQQLDGLRDINRSERRAILMALIGAHITLKEMKQHSYDSSYSC